ncbi:lantibiotic protection ABC transporter ATP-binding protein [Bacillus siamensis]|uniref:lantibiotic protection ABC transporter ATP-binding protein n=1 Tax=Bacillus siamensis TaxID=659243 RepID=UPI002DB5792C|nr:lantibiotic protection ABC transporter ATP-binding protein [Bacillus siamensis]MEC3655224.1 lantibiotic protection ABC transporter ATP-binding protein [Bacillus siamensis]
MSNILETRQLQKSFGRQQAVADVSLSVKRNSIYGLLGPNGAGKSTTLKILTGILQQTSGEVLFDGHPWKRKDLKKISSLIEAPPLYSNLTAAENLKVRCVMLGLPDSRIAEVLEITGLTGTGKKRAGQFSMGMKQRLGIALALVNRPSLLILDEPTNGLDPMGIQDLREFIRSLPGQGMTVILSSHLLSEVEQIADHIGIISDGVLGYQGEISREDDLEQLFLEVVKSTREKAGAGK